MLGVLRFGSAAIAGAIVLAIAGCGGTTSSSTARIRAVNCCPNGGSATIYVNSGSANGSQNFQQSSSYLYIDGGDSTFSYLLSSYSTLSPPATTSNLIDGYAYTVMLIGRADVSTSDSRYPKLELFHDDHGAPPSGDAYVRVVNAAPDAGSITATSGGSSVATDLSYAISTSYVALPAGSASLVVTPSAVSAVTQTATFQAGHSYSVILIEPTLYASATSPGTYAIWILDDDV
jgi:hypothetical protein